MVERFQDDQQANSFLEYLISQGLQGNHILFSNDQIRRAFSKSEHELERLGSQKVEQVREVLREILTLPNMEEKKEFIQRLPEDIQNIIILLYFQILEKNLLSKKPKLH